MRNFTQLLLISILFFSCSKDHEDLPGSSNTNLPAQPPAPPPAPVTTLSILVNDTVMNITSMSYERHGTGNGGGMTITASNNVQKVIATAYNWYQNSPWQMMYTMEVSYFTRTDSTGDWGVTYTRPVPRDDRVMYNNFMPLADSVVTGNFTASFNAKEGNAKENKLITVKGNFQLVFIK
jgi:hypothetical protein